MIQTMAHPPSFDDGRPPFDQGFAQELLDKCVLVGITHEDRRGAVKRHEQFHGTVVRADPKDGIQLTLAGTRSGETRWLPPDTRVFQPAPKGQYRLRSTGEVVSDPDFTVQWTVTLPNT